jgi:hypothetical protein
MVEPTAPAPTIDTFEVLWVLDEAEASEADPSDSKYIWIPL